MAKASGRQEQSGRDLVFQQWFEDNIVPAGKGGAIEEAAIYKAYRKDVHGGTALGRQGVHRMLNQLGVRRSVRQGKPMRLNVGFRPLVSAAPAAAEATGPSISPRHPRDNGLGLLVTGGLRDAARLSAYRVTFEGEGWRAVVLGEDGPAMRSLAVVSEVYAERRRQVAEEGFDTAHDDASDPGAHERAAACYAYAGAQADHHAAFVDVNAKRPRAMGTLGWMVRDMIVVMWPWAMGWFKPKTDEPDWKRRCLVKAGALVIAAIERIDRAKARASLEASQAKDMTGV